MTILFYTRFISLVVSFFVSFEVMSDQGTYNEKNQKRLNCIEKYVDNNLTKGEKQIIYRACERLVSNNERKQKIAKCTLKEIGKHSLTVLIIKQNDCVHHFLHHKYE